MNALTIFFGLAAISVALVGITGVLIGISIHLRQIAATLHAIECELKARMG